MPSLGARCSELRIRDEDRNWRILDRIDKDAIVILEIFAKKTGKIPSAVLNTCKARLKAYDQVV